MPALLKWTHGVLAIDQSQNIDDTSKTDYRVFFCPRVALYPNKTEL
jgi:hypothetical protein